MKWFKKMLWHWSQQGREVDESGAKLSRQLISSDETSINDDPVLNFRVYNAVGGKIVEFRYYNRVKDHNHSQTYIITNDQDFGERIAKIATLESLKQ